MATDRNAPATRGDLEDFFGMSSRHIEDSKVEANARLDALDRQIEDFKAEVNTRFHAFEHRLEQLLAEMESRMMTSTYRLAESMQHRMAQAEVTEAALNARLAVLEERLTELEKRLSVPPQQVQ